MNLFNRSIGNRLAAGFLLILFMMLGVAYLGIHGMQKSNDALHHVVSVNVKKMEALEEMSKSIHIVSRVIRTIALLSDVTQAKKEHEKIDDARRKYRTALEKLEKMPLDDSGKKFIKDIASAQFAASALNDKFVAMTHEKKDEAVLFLLSEAGPANARWQGLIQDFIDLQELKNQADEETAIRAYKVALILVISITVAAIVCGIFIAWLTSRSIIVPLSMAVEMAKRVSNGDLSSVICVDSADETGQLMQALRNMNDNLVDIVTKVRTGAETICVATSQIATGNLDLSSRTEEQAGSLEETASSMEELTSTVKQNAEHVRQANALAVSASEIALQGGDVVNEVVSTMGAIHTSSQRIVDIINVIEGIAFQTNILALNAAVEAAHAGAQGRGFAAVASEVRNLAQRSSAAAKEIKVLIEESVERVEAGSRLVGQAGVTMESVVSSIKKVTDIMGEISIASQEQASGIDQINQAVIHMDEVTQQNASLVEEAAAAAAALEEQAKILLRLVSIFKVRSQPQTSEYIEKEEKGFEHDQGLKTIFSEKRVYQLEKH